MHMEFNSLFDRVLHFKYCFLEEITGTLKEDLSILDRANNHLLIPFLKLTKLMLQCFILITYYIEHGR